MSSTKIQHLWNQYNTGGKKYIDAFSAGQREFLLIVYNENKVEQENKIKQELMEEVWHRVRSSKNMLQVFDKLGKIKFEDYKY